MLAIFSPLFASSFTAAACYTKSIQTIHSKLPATATTTTPDAALTEAPAATPNATPNATP